MTSAYVRRDPKKPVADRQTDQRLDLTLTLLRSLVFSGPPEEVISHTIFPGEEKRALVRFEIVSSAQGCLRKMRQHQEVTTAPL